MAEIPHKLFCKIIIVAHIPRAVVIYENLPYPYLILLMLTRWPKLSFSNWILYIMLMWLINLSAIYGHPKKQSLDIK